jgi:hypothetical protein
VGNRAYREGRYDEAAAALRRAVGAAQRTTPRDWRLVVSLTNLGHVLRSQRRLTEAEAVYREAVASAEELRSEDHPDLVDPLKNLGIFYYEQRWYSRAGAVFARLLRMASRGWSAADRVRQVAYANVLSDLAELQGRYDEAGRLQLETIRVLGAPVPLDRSALGMTLAQLSLLLRAQGRDAEAIEAAARAVQILAMAGADGETTIRLAIKLREETLGPEHPGVERRGSVPAASAAACGDVAGHRGSNRSRGERPRRECSATGQRSDGGDRDRRKRHLQGGPYVKTLGGVLVIVLVGAVAVSDAQQPGPAGPGQMGPGMMRGMHQQMMGTMQQMGGMMQQMGEMMAGGQLSPDQVKRMGELIKQMGSMMDGMASMGGGRMGSMPEMSRMMERMAEMHRQMAEMLGQPGQK